MDAVAPSTVAQRSVPILAHDRIARDTYRLRLGDPLLARAIRPGQFVMIRPTDGSDPLLGRPFALYDTARDRSGVILGFDVVYLVVGRGTAKLAERRVGETLNLWGPLGNGFGPPPTDDGEIVFVAGGIGQTPFLALGRWWTGRETYGESPIETAANASTTLLYGVRSADLAAGLDDFRAAGIGLEIATDDGSLGHRGYVTDLLKRRLEQGRRPVKVVGCGPAPMLRALSKIVEDHALAADLSLENHMACGFGACFSCVALIRQDDGSGDLRRVCVEGPIFPAARVVWDSAPSSS